MERTHSYSHRYLLTAGESDAEGRMPLTLVVERVIEVASEHANRLGIGYDALLAHGIGWVLSRISVEMSRYPAINKHYTFTTWIESYNRRFSERCFCITADSGEVLGYARTIWVAIDFKTRAAADLSVLGADAFVVADLPCPIERTPRLPALTSDDTCAQYTFGYRDIDFNRHVNTIRYLDLILNHWPLGHYDEYAPARFDILFHQECVYGEAVDLRFDDSGICEIVKDDGTRALAAHISWMKRQTR